MIINILILVFLAGFVALALFGHFLLLSDFWRAQTQAQGDDRIVNDAMKVPAE
jgi:hypothetical protein